MAETLRELVVSLSLNSSSFDQNIKSVNQRIKEAESNFRLAAAGTAGFDNSMRGAATRVSALKQKLDLQNQAVAQFEQKLAKASAALEKARTTTDKQAVSLAASKRAHEQLTSEIQKTEAAYKESVRTTGDNSDASNELGLKLLDLKEKEKALVQEIKAGEAKLDSATQSIQRNENAVSRAQTGLNNAKTAVKETRSELDRLASGLGTAGAALGVLAGKAVKAGEAMTTAGRKLSTRVTAPLVALGAYAIKSAMDFESAFAGVRKTVNATEEEFARLEQSVKDMSLEVPSNTTTIAGVMEIAGQLGIATDNLETFTRTMIDLANSTNMSAEEAATAIAQFSNITGMAQGDAGLFGSALVDLGNNFATNEQAIMNMSMRLAAAGAQVGLSESQILGFATALSSVGIEAEAGGTAFSKVMTKMEVAVATGKNGLEDFAKVSGMSQKEFQKAWKEDAAGAIEAFIVGLSKMDEAGISAIVTLEDMGLKEVRLSDTLLRATNATEDFARAQSVAASAWSEGTALATEAETRYNTLASQLAMLKNKVSVAAQSLGDEMVPMAKRVIEAVSGLIDRFMALSTEQKEQIVKWAAIAAAIGPALIVFGKITSGAGKTVRAILDITRAMKGLGVVNLGWIGLAVAGVAGLAVAIKALSDATPTLEKTLDTVFSGTDQETYERGKVAFDVQIETTITADDYQTKINTAIDNIKNYLKDIKGLDEVEQARVSQAISAGSGIDVLKQALEEMGVKPGTAAKITGTYQKAMTDISEALEGLNLSQTAIDHIVEVAAAGGDVEAALVEYGIEDGKAEEIAGQITGSMSEIDAAIKKLGLSPEDAEALKAGALSDRRLIGIALKLMGAPQEVVDAVLASYDTVAGSMTGKITGLLDEVAAALTDGKPDDPKTMKALEEKFRTYFSNAVDLVNQWAADEIAKLDVTSADYDADVANIQTKAGEMRTALEGQQTAALSFLSAMAGKSAEQVRARLGELAEVEEAVQAILAEIEAANAAANEQGAQASKITKKGSARDIETTTRAFGYETRTHQSTMDALEAQYNADLIALESKYDELGKTEFETQSSALADKYKADTAAALAAYGASINELLHGLGQSLATANPELAAAMQEAAEKLDIAGQVQSLIMADYDPENFELPEMSDGVKAALQRAMEDFGLDGDIESLDYAGFQTMMALAAETLEYDANEALSGITLDAGWIDDALKVALEAGTFDGLDDIDMSTATGKMLALFKPVGESAGAGLEEGVNESADKATTAVENMAGGLGGAAKAVLESSSPSRVFARIGDDIVSGLVSGVNRSTWRLKFAMVAMARTAISAAKAALGIASPSKLFRDEVGRMMVRGIAVGVESETEQQKRAIANAARQMTAAARGGVTGEVNRVTNDSRNQSVIINIDRMDASSKQDVEALAQRIAALQIRRQRGYGY